MRVGKEAHYDKLIGLMKNYNKNLKKLSQLENDQAVREWEQDYRARRMDGAIKSVSVPLHQSEHGVPTSIQERMILEEERVVEKLYGLKLGVQMVQLLLLGLDDEERKLIESRYFKNKSVVEICEELFISRSTYYRRLNDVMDKMLASMRVIYDEQSENDGISHSEDDEGGDSY